MAGRSYVVSQAISRQVVLRCYSFCSFGILQIQRRTPNPVTERNIEYKARGEEIGGEG